MGYVTTKDGVELFYKDWGPRDAQVIYFHHGWPLSSDDWDAQMLFFLAEGFRVVAHDRRGHGRSSQVWDGHDMDHYADDVAAVVERLGVRGSSTISRRSSRPIARSSTRTFPPARSMATTVPGRSPRKGSSATGGGRA